MYTVIFASGRIMTFNIKAVAEMYAQTMESKRGHLITPEMVEIFKRLETV